MAQVQLLKAGSKELEKNGERSGACEYGIICDVFQNIGMSSMYHGGLGGDVTPSEAALIKVGGDNKWKTIIQNASLSKDSGV